MGLKLKKKYENVTLTSGRLKSFNTIDINESNIQFYIQKGFAFIFEEEEEKPKKKNK